MSRKENPQCGTKRTRFDAAAPAGTADDTILDLPVELQALWLPYAVTTAVELMKLLDGIGGWLFEAAASAEDLWRADHGSDDDCDDDAAHQTIAKRVLVRAGKRLGRNPKVAPLLLHHLWFRDTRRVAAQLRLLQCRLEVDPTQEITAWFDRCTSSRIESTVVPLKLRLVRLCVCSSQFVDVNEIVEHFGSTLEVVEFRMLSSSTGRPIEAIATMSSLRSISISNAFDFRGNSMRSLSPLRFLVELSIANNSTVGDNDIAEIAHLRALQSITFRWCCSITDDGMDRGLPPLMQLKKLTITDCPLVGGPGASWLGKLEHVETFNFCIAVDPSNVSLPTLLINAPRSLTELQVQRASPVETVGLLLASSLPSHLRSVEFFHSRLCAPSHTAPRWPLPSVGAASATVAHLSIALPSAENFTSICESLPMLRRLELHSQHRSTTWTSEAYFAKLALLKDLEFLRLECEDLMPTYTFTNLCAAASLRHLMIGQTPLEWLTRSASGEWIAGQLRHLPLLQRFGTVSDLDIGDELSSLLPHVLIVVDP